MYAISDSKSPDVNIKLSNMNELKACCRALGAAQLKAFKTSVSYEKILAIERRSLPSMMEAGLSEDALRGLADIALGEYGQQGFSGLRQQEADSIIDELSGDAEYFFYPILTEAARRWHS